MTQTSSTLNLRIPRLFPGTWHRPIIEQTLGMEFRLFRPSAARTTGLDVSRPCTVRVIRTRAAVAFLVH